MIWLSSGLRVYLACGVTDMRKGMVGLSMLVQQNLAEEKAADEKLTTLAENEVNRAAA